VEIFLNCFICAFISEVRMKQGRMEMIVNKIELSLKFLSSLVSNGLVVKFYDHKILAFLCINIILIDTEYRLIFNALCPVEHTSTCRHLRKIRIVCRSAVFCKHKFPHRNKMAIRKQRREHESAIFIRSKLQFQY